MGYSSLTGVWCLITACGTELVDGISTFSTSWLIIVSKWYIDIYIYIYIIWGVCVSLADVYLPKEIELF